jgi:DNA-nicking Smr family endonuclease
MPKLSDLKTLYDAARAKRPDAASALPKVTTPASPAPEREIAASSVKRHIAASKHADADIDLAQAFADVQRLAKTNRATLERARPQPIARQHLLDEADALEASKYGAEPAPHAWDIGQEVEGEQTFLRAGLRSDVLSKLRRGHWVVQAALDLHGLTSEEARDTLADFLLDARTQGLRCVRIIHGKGLTSPNREPVLKGRVRKWLSHWDDVLAFCEAQANAGGSGAVVVLLRGRG